MVVVVVRKEKNTVGDDVSVPRRESLGSCCPQGGLLFNTQLTTEYIPYTHPRVHYNMADSLLSYLPPFEGLLPKWLFLVR